MNITIYSTTTCATCHLVTEWLDKKGQKYIKKNTDEDPATMMEFMSVNDGMVGVPFTVISEGDNVIEKITGFDQAKFTKALGL